MPAIFNSQTCGSPARHHLAPTSGWQSRQSCRPIRGAERRGCMSRQSALGAVRRRGHHPSPWVLAREWSMLSVASWLQSLTAAPPLLLDGMTIHPLIGPGAADPALDALGRSNRRVTVLALAPRGPGRFVATVAEPGAQTLLMLQGEELVHDGDLLELVMPRLVPAEGIATVDVRRRKPGGGAPSGKVEARLQRLDAFAPPVGTVGYLAMRGRELARLELFPGPVTCSNRWWWALGSVVELA